MQILIHKHPTCAVARNRVTGEHLFRRPTVEEAIAVAIVNHRPTDIYFIGQENPEEEEW